MLTRSPKELTFRDVLSRLSHVQACRLLGPEGSRLIMQGGKFEVDIAEQVELTDTTLTVRFPEAVATLQFAPDVRGRLRWHCTRCRKACDHIGALFSLVLEEKTPLGLAVPPDADVPLERLPEDRLILRMIAEREQRAVAEKMDLVSADKKMPWTDYRVTSRVSGKTYRVALRGLERGDSYCTCPDFRSNTLGTCKHIIRVSNQVKRVFSKARLTLPYRRTRLGVHVRYAEQVELRLLLPETLSAAVKHMIEPIMNKPISQVHDLVERLRKLQARGEDVLIYPDAEEWIQRCLFKERITVKVSDIRRDPKHHPLRTTLLKTDLLPYQLDGIAFAVGAGRAVLADDMGLGKTIQGVGVAEFLAREAGIGKVLVVCPTSLKSQWRAEIIRFSDRPVQLVLGGAQDRVRQYENAPFFTVCNYEQVLRDIMAIETVKWDLIILDEGQRIKNWAAKTSRVIKGLKSPFALVLSGTPMENRLEELFSVVEFIDERRLGPAFRFFHRHRVVDERGKVLGYKNMAELREKLQPVLLRRTRESVMQELPPRTTEVIRIAATEEQAGINSEHMRIIGQIVRKPFITEMDLLRLQKSLLMCRMAADSTFLVNKEPPGFSSKLEELNDLLTELAAEKDRKILLFSEWTTMLDLIEPLLEKLQLRFVRLDGSVPQKQRQQLVHTFQHEPECKVFITTNAGSTGLNLQAANTVINVDLPWNPAVLEQRIARAHRMGQKRSVQVYILVTEQTLEENMLATLAMKKDLALAALDPESSMDQVDLASGMDELKRRLELLLGAKPEAPTDESGKAGVTGERAAHEAEYRQRMAEAGGRFMTAAFGLIAELLPAHDQSGSSAHLEEEFKRRLAGCLTRDAVGRLSFSVTLPDASSLDVIAGAMARLVPPAAS